MAKKQKQKRPSAGSSTPRVRVNKHDRLAAAVSQEWAHANSFTIHGKRRVLQYELTEIENAIAAMTAAIAKERERRSQVEAIIRGMTSVLEKRQGC